MYHEKPPASAPPAPHPDLVSLLDTLPDALIFLDAAGTIQYVNAPAAALLGAKKHELAGKTLWQGAPQLVTTTLYQAVMKALRTRKPLEVEYYSPITRRWLRMYLSPTSQGMAIFFSDSEKEESTLPQTLLHQSEQRYQDLLEGIGDGIAILTPEGLVLEMNQYPLVATQVRREEVIGRPITDLPAWSSMPFAQQRLRAAIARASRGETVHFEARVRAHGRHAHLAMTIIPHYAAHQQVDYLICSGWDITKHKHAEEQFRALVDAIPQFVWIARPDGSAEYHNRRWCDYTGLSNEQSQGEGWLQPIHPDDRQKAKVAWQKSVRAGIPHEIEYRYRNGTTGEYRWFLIQGVPQKDAKGAILKWVGTCTDIDNQKRAEQRLEASEENLRVLAEMIPQFVWITRPDGFVEYWNQQFASYLQATPEQIRGYGWHQFLHPADHDRVVSVRRYTLETGEPYEITYRLRNGKTGVYHWFLSRAAPVRDEDGQISKWFGTCTNIDEQKRIEEVLRQSQERAQALMDSNIIGIFISNDGQVMEANDTYLRMTGYTREDLHAGKINWVHMTPPEYAAQTEQTFRELAVHHYRTPYEKEYICKDGSRLPVVVGGVVLQDDPHQIIGFVLDNSARKELEQRKDDFLSMAGHELKTPLTALKLQTQLVKRRLAKQGLHEIVAALARMEEPVRQLERLIGELLDVSKIQAGRLEYVKEPVDLDALLHEVAETMQQMNSSHTIVVRGTASHCVIGDKGRLEQIFINLLSNAIKYAPDAPLIEVEASTSSESVTIKVRDHGIGIPSEQREKIFERFYRASDPSHRAIPGLGMGLYIVAEIVMRMGGTITVESEVGKGSTFVVTLLLEKPIEHDSNGLHMT